MQSIATLSSEGFTELAEFVFESGAPVVFHAYSAYGQPLRSFRKPSEFTADIESAFATGQKSLHFALHYPDTKGHVAEREITLDPKKCAGHTWRYTVEGWGLIQFQGDLRRAPAIECRIAVNTQKRAVASASTYPEFKDPDLWDWKAVQLHAGRIIRRMKKNRQTQQMNHHRRRRGWSTAVAPFAFSMRHSHFNLNPASNALRRHSGASA